MKNRKIYLQYYKTLEVQKNSNWADLKLSYKRLVGIWHPDKYDPNSSEYAIAEQNLKEINTAYAALSDYKKLHGGLPFQSFSSQLADYLKKSASAGDAGDVNKPTQNKWPTANLAPQSTWLPVHIKKYWSYWALILTIIIGIPIWERNIEISGWYNGTKPIQLEKIAHKIGREDEPTIAVEATLAKSIGATKLTKNKLKPKIEPAVWKTPNSEAGNSTKNLITDSEGKLAIKSSPARHADEVLPAAKGDYSKTLALLDLPKDKFGIVDWDVTVKKQLINPAGSLPGDKKEAPPFDLDILIKTKSDFVNNVMFRHKPHGYWLDCNNCHAGILGEEKNNPSMREVGIVESKGTIERTMQGIVQGQWCGRCHGTVAFALTGCKRCHSESRQ